MLEKNSFVLFTEYAEEISMLSDEAAGQLMKAIFAYETTGDAPELSGEGRLLFSIFKRRLDDNREKYQKKCQRNAQNAKNGGRPKKEANPDFENPKKANVFFGNPKGGDTDLDLDTDTEGQEKKDKSGAGTAGRTKSFHSDSPAYKAAVYLEKQIRSRLPSKAPASEKQLQAWADIFDKCNRLDKYSWDEISQVLRFSQKDQFWQSNILSAKKFREKYVQLLAKMRSLRASPGGCITSANKSYDLDELEQLASLRLPDRL